MAYGKAAEEVPHVRIEVRLEEGRGSRGGFSVGKALVASALFGKR